MVSRFLPSRVAGEVRKEGRRERGRLHTRLLMAAAPTLFTITMNSSTANITMRRAGDMVAELHEVPGSRTAELWTVRKNSSE